MTSMAVASKQKKPSVRQTLQTKSNVSVRLAGLKIQPLAILFVGLALILTLVQSRTLWMPYWLPITGFQLETPLTQVREADIQRILAPWENYSLPLAPLDDISATVAANPWILSASLRRAWPDSLLISIVENQATALVNEQWLINQNYQQFLKVEQTQTYQDLPKVYCQPHQIAQVMDNLRLMQQAMKHSDLAVRELHLSKRGAWTAHLANGTVLKIGRQDFIKRIEKYIALLPIIEQQQEQKLIVSADLRYDTGIAVQFDTELLASN